MIRESFGIECGGNDCSLIFILGKNQEYDERGKSIKKHLNVLLTSFYFKVIQESEEFHDLLVEDFMDSYNNLTLKSLFMLKFMSDKSEFSHLLKTDDDCLVK